MYNQRNDCKAMTSIQGSKETSVRTLIMMVSNYGLSSWIDSLSKRIDSSCLKSKTKKSRYESEEMEFIVDVQSSIQYGKGKWWRNQPRWLVRGTNQALVKWRLTMCELLWWSCLYPWGFRSIISKPYWKKRCNASNILWSDLDSRIDSPKWWNS